MECIEVKKRIQDYIEGLITPEEESLIRTHLESCKKCEAAYSDLIKTVEHIKDLKEVEPPSWLTQKVMTKVKEEAAKEGIWKRLFYPLHIKLPLEALATVLVAVTALYIFKAAEHETKIAEVRPGNVEVQQLRRDDTLRQKAAETVDAKEKSVVGETTDKALSSGTSPTVPPAADTAQEPGRDNLSPVIAQKESSGKNIPQAPPAPAPQLGPQSGKKDASGSGVEGLTESRAADKHRATGSMKYAAPLQKEELTQRPASTAPIAIPEMTTSQEGRMSRKAITLNLYVTNVDQANDEIRQHLARLRGRIAEAETVHGKMVLAVEIDSKNIKEFFEKLRTVGELREKEPPAGMTEGNVKVKIEIVKKPDR